MKCRVCGGLANIRLPQYNSALCAADFIAFFEKRVSGTITKYGLLGEHDKTLVAVSGGKDSLSLWYLMNRLGFSADGIYIDLGIQDYSHVSLVKDKTDGGQAAEATLFVLFLRDLQQRDRRACKDHEKTSLLSLRDDQEVRDEQGLHRIRLLRACNRSQPG